MHGPLMSWGHIARRGWNFHKYLVGRDGPRLIDWYASTTNPNGNKIRKAIEAALKA